ncbi:MAG: CCC motif membrane protein [Odoribacter sp.]
MEITDKAQRDLPNSSAILVLGILSLVFCWCYGFIGLILGIIAVVMANGQRKIYLEATSAYTESSFKNLNAGRICGIIGISISAFILALWLFIFLGIVTLGLGALGLGTVACGL